MELAVESGFPECHYPGVPSQGKELRARRKRLKWTVRQAAKAAGISHETAINIEKDRGGQTKKLEAYVAAIDRRESEHLVAQAAEVRHTDPLNYPVHSPSTDGVTAEESDTDDPAPLSSRELAAVVEAQGREIQAMRNVLDTLVKASAQRDPTRKVAQDSPRRGKRNR